MTKLIKPINIRKDFIITQEQDNGLKELKLKTGFSYCELVRRAIDELLKQNSNGK